MVTLMKPALALFLVIAIFGAAPASDLRVISDDQPDVTAIKKLVTPAKTGPEPLDRLLEQKEQEIRRLEPSMEEEERLMTGLVQTMDRDAAGEWAATFISEKPLNCPKNHQHEWIDAILFALEQNNLPLCKEAICLTASIISIESGFRSDPLAFDPSHGDGTTKLLERAEREFQEKYGAFLALPPVKTLYETYKEKYYSKLVACRTEGQVEIIARSIADDLRKDISRLPNMAQNIINKEISKLEHIVRTKGSMQLSFLRAKMVMKERGETFTDRELTDYMYTIRGGVDVGVAAIKPMFVQYAARYGSPGNMSWLFFVGMDYHYGPFSSRNMMEQVRIKDLSGKKIPIDGDLLQYDDCARPSADGSLTLHAASKALPDMPEDKILEAFLMEKDPHYIYTEVHKLITRAHQEKFGETPFAVVGELRMGNQAQLKHGLLWKTRVYLNKLDRYLNAMPWD